MKIFKKIILCISLISLLIVPVSAKESEHYKEQYEASNAEKMEQYLSDETKSLLEELKIDISDYGSLKAPEFKSIFKVIFDCLTKGIKTPFITALSAVGIILIFSLINTTLSLEESYGGYNIFLVLIIGLVVISPLASLIDATAQILKGLTVFLTVFTPILAGILTSMGYVATAGGMSAAVIGVSQFMSQFISLLLVPITKAVTCLGFCGSLSLVDGVVKMCAILKNGVLWCFATVSAIFLSVLGMQTSIAISSDSLAFKTSKSVISGLIPVMGPLISETLTTAKGCLNVLKTGVGIYGILALCLSVLPILISLISWKACMTFASAVGSLFSTDEVISVFKTVDFCLSILIGATVFTLLVYVISFGIILKSGG